jgi:tRNA threonylcarbamoyladenosine biosynthesis protein TsaE
MSPEDSSLTVELTSDSPERTIEIGERIGSTLQGGETLYLIGPLGSGKTHLIKGIARGAGVEETTAVISPTFVLVNEYFARPLGLELYHIDAYRLNSPSEFEQLGFDDLCRPDAVVMIEWADRVMSVLRDVKAIRIDLMHAGQTQRKICVKNISAALEAVLTR